MRCLVSLAGIHRQGQVCGIQVRGQAVFPTQERAIIMIDTAARILVTVVFTSLLSMGCAQAQYPSKPVQMVVPYGAGSADLMARITTTCLSPRLKQPVLVVNKPGANTQLGGNFVKNSPPDGYTLILTSSATVTDLATTRTPSFDVRQDLEPITKLVYGKQGLYVNAASPINTVSEFIAYAKANPGKVNYATTGIASVNHLSTEAMALNAGISMVHIPYAQGTGALLTGLMSGEIQFVMVGMSGAQAALSTGKIRLLAVLEKQRAPSRPNLPTLVEDVPAMAAFTGTLWWGVFAPPKTSKDVIQKVHAEIVGCLNDQTVRGALKKLGFEDSEIVGNTPEEFRDSIIDDVNHLKDVVQRAKLPLL